MFHTDHDLRFIPYNPALHRERYYNYGCSCGFQRTYRPSLAHQQCQRFGHRLDLWSAAYLYVHRCHRCDASLFGPLSRIHRVQLALFQLAEHLTGRVRIRRSYRTAPPPCRRADGRHAGDRIMWRFESEPSPRAREVCQRTGHRLDLYAAAYHDFLCCARCRARLTDPLPRRQRLLLALILHHDRLMRWLCGWHRWSGVHTTPGIPWLMYCSLPPWIRRAYDEGDEIFRRSSALPAVLLRRLRRRLATIVPLLGWSRCALHDDGLS